MAVPFCRKPYYMSFPTKTEMKRGTSLCSRISSKGNARVRCYRRFRVTGRYPSRVKPDTISPRSLEVASGGSEAFWKLSFVGDGVKVVASMECRSTRTDQRARVIGVVFERRRTLFCCPSVKGNRACMFTGSRPRVEVIDVWVS